jgi:hypothetical protein
VNAKKKVREAVKITKKIQVRRKFLLGQEHVPPINVAMVQMRGMWVGINRTGAHRSEMSVIRFIDKAAPDYYQRRDLRYQQSCSNILSRYLAGTEVGSSWE